MGNWKHKFEELAKLIDKIYEMQGPVLQLTDKQTNQSTEEPISRVRKLERLFGEFGQRDECASSDLLEELNNVKETLKQEMTISKGLRRTIENLQEENKTLAKTAEHERNDGIEIRKIYNLEFKVQSKTKDEERASSVISLGASSGYQSEEPDESSKFFSFCSNCVQRC